MGRNYEPEAIANAFIMKAKGCGCLDLTPMKLLKLVYISHGWYLGIKGQGLISSDIQAWQYGPVIPDLYHKIKEYGNNHISETIKNLTFDGNGTGLKLQELDVDPKDTEVKSLIDTVWKVYGEMTGIQLSNLTHESGSPWDQVTRGFSGFFSGNSITIPNDLIKKYYEEKAGRN